MRRLIHIFAGWASAAALVVSSALLTACGPSAMASEDGLRIEVRAQILSSEGDPFGGTFAVVSRPDRTVLVRGRCAADGRVSRTVEVPGGARSLTVVTISRGMIRNTPDETGSRVPVTGRDLEAPEWDVLFDALDVGDPVDHALSKEDDFSGILSFDGGTGTLDIVRRTLALDAVRDGILDFGDLRFPTAHAWFRVEVDLVDAEGRPSEARVRLGGLPHRRRSMWGNRHYPHFALSQVGSKVRIIGTRAAWRLLCANPVALLVLEPVAGGSGWCLVRFEPDQIEAIGEFRRRLEGRCVLSGPGLADRPELKQPDFWDIGEHGF